MASPPSKPVSGTASSFPSLSQATRLRTTSTHATRPPAVDTAQGYNNEEETAQSLKDGVQLAGISTGDIFLTTKGNPFTLEEEGTSPSQIPSPRSSMLTAPQCTVSTENGDPNAAGIALEDLRESVKKSLARLGRQPDLLLVHNPFVPPKGKLVEFWKILEELKDDGTITASLGVSNFRPQVRESVSDQLPRVETSGLTVDSPPQDFEELLPQCKYKPVVNQIGESLCARPGPGRPFSPSR